MNYNNDHFQIFRECLKQVSVKELNDRINEFKLRANLRSITDKALKNDLRRLLKVIINGQEHTLFMRSDVLTPPHEIFHLYRVRKASIDDNLSELYFPSIRTKEDVWAKPAHLVDTYGRLNRIGESMLYATNQLTNAIYETECLNGDLFFVLVYTNIKQIRVAQVHNMVYIDEMSETDNAKLLLLHNFLLSEFTRVVPKGQEYLYKSSISIYEEFFNSDGVDAFTYPSIRSQFQNGYNICFTPQQAEDNLKFLGVMVCSLNASRTTTEEFKIGVHADGFLNKQGTVDFYPYNCEISRERFGNFNMIRDSVML